MTISVAKLAEYHEKIARMRWAISIGRMCSDRLCQLADDMLREAGQAIEAYAASQLKQDTNVPEVQGETN